MILRINKVLSRLGISRTTLYRWMDEGIFPKPFHLGPNAIGWREEDINQWEWSAKYGPEQSKSAKGVEKVDA
jgi:prophage regulatory protein